MTTPAAPTAVRRAGLIVLLQGVAALVVAVVLVVRGIAGATSMWSTAWPPRAGSCWSAPR
ncbi:hypothetical protein O979_02415 [Mycobacterium avium subsp. paratuberculosis 10-4404]|nr:hypothetical protein O979_02415 [Mycobacterium avium subsp. paratuberculosis 10-4404]ETB07681.1 hypothetical protein O978_02595 [Mycobacterium avium subsp. paratuberculosis 10-5864]